MAKNQRMAQQEVNKREKKKGSGSKRGLGRPGQNHLPASYLSTQLQAKKLRFTCPALAPSKRQPGLVALLGQERPLAALRTGLSLYAVGYNVFVSGLVGSGRTRLVQALIRQFKPKGRPVPDRVFVSNFREPKRPRLLTLPRGTGPRFRSEMHELAHSLRETLQNALASRAHKLSRDLVLRSAEHREKRLMSALDRHARQHGCAVVQFPGPSGGTMADIYPIFEGEPVNPEAYRDLVAQGRLSRDRLQEISSQRERLMVRLEEVTERLIKFSQDTERELRRMDRQVVGHLLEVKLRGFGRRWQVEEVDEFLESLRAHVIQNLETWVSPPHEPPHEPPPGPPHEPSHGSLADVQEEGVGAEPPMAHAAGYMVEPLSSHGVDVQVVKTSDGDDCPVILETHPTYSNLFGTVEIAREGQPPSPAEVHPGSLLRADGGYLILRVPELMSEPGVWMQLKRALKVGKIDIREFDPSSGVTSGTLQPQAIPIDLKVVLIGDHGVHEILAHEDPQFLQTFKVHAEFDMVLPATRANMRRYADLMAWLASREGLKPFDDEANAALVEYGARRAGRRDRLTANYGELTDLAREASHLCEGEGAAVIGRQHIQQAIRQRLFRADLPREVLDREFQDGYLLLQTSGRAVGQVNALTVIESGSRLFGKPSRITATTGPASADRSRLLNIEREAELSGPIHDKGVMILSGFLLGEFAQEGPLCLQANICFEQTYGGVDGDSASGAELFALLSSLTEIPLDQGIAVTGAINQRGVVQAVSAVNEKIEGFFRLCRSRRLTGKQGVILPKANVRDLMLDPEVVEAVEQGRFRIHAIGHVDQGLEILTQRPAAEIKSRALEQLQRYRSQAGGGGRRSRLYPP